MIIDRYVIDKPKDGGSSYWTITDVHDDLTLVEIFKTVPNVEKICQQIVESLISK
jgi:hypothetical protein